MSVLNDRSDPVAFLATRRSGKPRDLAAPGPDDATLRQMLQVAARTPDHGKLFPWRFVVIDDRRALAALLRRAWQAEKGEPGATDLAGIEEFAHQAPRLVVVLSSPSEARPIPLWEQHLSAGAAAMNLLHAANAFGFSGSWLTGWASYSPIVQAALCRPHERIAGFIFIGTPGRTLSERPRPDLGTVVAHWPEEDGLVG